MVQNIHYFQIRRIPWEIQRTEKTFRDYQSGDNGDGSNKSNHTTSVYDKNTEHTDIINSVQVLSSEL